MRKILFNLHLYAGLVAGIFIIIFGLTGAIMAFEPEIDHLLHWKMAYVTPGGRALSLAEISAAVAKAYPGEPIGDYELSTTPGLSYRVALPRRFLYVNQYTGEVLGEGKYGMDFLSYVHQLHLRLLIMTPPDPGKKIMSWAGVAMSFLLLSGVYLWWPYQRVTIQWSGSAIRRWFDIHAVVGIFSFVFLVVLAITGVVIGFEEKTTPLFFRLTRSEPSPRPEGELSPAPGAKRIAPDQALEIARAALPGAAPFEINAPGPKEVYEIRLRYPEDLTPGGRSAAIVDPYTGKVLFAEGSRTAPAGARVVIANRAIHTGDIFGIPSKAVLSLASLMSVMQVVSGVMMWWRKAKKERRVAAGHGDGSTAV